MKNDYGSKSLGSRGFFLSLIVLLISTGIAVVLDIPVLRQVLGFIYLTFLPGLLLVFILKLNKLGLVEKIVLSVGLSVAFSMLFGLALNGSLLALGYTQPLSTTSLLISFGIATIILAIIAYIRNKDITFPFPSLKLATGEKAFLIVPSLFPLLSIVGMRIMNLTDNNVMLMVLLFMIPAYVIFLSFSNRKVSGRVYPIAIFLISISLLLMYSLRSNHIIGSDVHREYFIFLTTMDNLKWSQLGFGTLDSCLSISILPAIYQTFLNMNPEYFFKIFFSLIFSVSPLVVYLLAKKYIGSFYAFLASFIFMSQIHFLWTAIGPRTNAAALFFALAILVLFHDSISEFSKRVLFIVFAASIIVSHYGTTYATFFVLLLTWLGMQILPKIMSREKEPTTLPAGNHVLKEDPPTLPLQERPPPVSNAPSYRATALEPSRSQLKKGITIAIITLFLTMLFLWYSEMTGPTFSAGVHFVYDSFAKWQWFLAEDIGGQPVQAAFGRTYPYTGVPQRIEFVYSWLTVLLISVGLLTAIRRIKTMVSTSFTRHEKPSFLLKKFDAEYFMLSIGCYLLLIATVVVPYVSEYYGAIRTYFQMMIPLSIFFVIGGIEMSRYLKSRPHWLILAVLIPYFLCTSGAMCQVFGFPRAMTLNSEGPLYRDMYVSDGDSYAARWIKGYAKEGEIIYAIGLSTDVLLSQGRIPFSQTDASLIPRYKEGKEVDGYIYLRYVDIDDGRLVAEYPGLLTGKSKIYVSGGSEIYR